MFFTVFTVLELQAQSPAAAKLNSGKVFFVIVATSVAADTTAYEGLLPLMLFSAVATKKTLLVNKIVSMNAKRRGIQISYIFITRFSSSIIEYKFVPFENL